MCDTVCEFCWQVSHTCLRHAGTALTGLVCPEQFLRFAPHGLAVLLEFEVAGLLPVGGADLEEVSAPQEVLEVLVALHTCENPSDHTVSANILVKPMSAPASSDQQQQLSDV